MALSRSLVRCKSANGRNGVLGLNGSEQMLAGVLTMRGLPPVHRICPQFVQGFGVRRETGKE